ncbi:putative PiggyBac transposable element-derived protein 4 [Hypsibius exemplaris]|uniref:PiggyBac transposable element-derived protein 4 n=1 Tax=Hypsibius exemplaris TaxID=2072580 RepID=A0A9X6RNB4_HYPEX|nr:putative PiggyBac transposable element-derived protein 4 [Hypsibius exemplaris]
MSEFVEEDSASEDDDIPADDEEILTEPDEPAEEIEELDDVWSDGDFSDDDDALYSLNDDPFPSENGKTNWQRSETDTGKTREANFMSTKPGVQPHAAARVNVIRDAFDLFFTVQMQAVILLHSHAEGLARYGDFWKPLTAEELCAYVGLLILMGVFKDATLSVADLWSNTDGRSTYSAVMSRTRFVQINCSLRFDDKSMRADRLKKDRIPHIRELLDFWTPTLRLNFLPHENMTVDEQLFPFRGRCAHKQYIPTKPRGKFGLKMWLLACAATCYCYYLGKKSGRNLTTDNFFTSVELAEELLLRNITLVGTIRKSREEIPRNLLPGPLKDRPLFSSIFGFIKELTLVSYVCRPRKCVILLSSQHHNAAVDTEMEEQKPEIVKVYNATKSGVDTLDQLVGTYSVRRKTNRWPMAFFYDMELGRDLVKPFVESTRSKIPNLSLSVKRTIATMIGKEKPFEQNESPGKSKSFLSSAEKKKRCVHCPVLEIAIYGSEHPRSFDYLVLTTDQRRHWEKILLQANCVASRINHSYGWDLGEYAFALGSAVV